MLTAIPLPINEHFKPAQQGELLGPMQNAFLGAHFIWSCFMTVCVIEAEPAVMRRLVIATNTAAVNNFISRCAIDLYLKIVTVEEIQGIVMIIHSLV